MLTPTEKKPQMKFKQTKEQLVKNCHLLGMGPALEC